MDAIQQTKVNMTVYLGNYNVPNDAGAAYDRQKQELQTAMQSFGTGNIGGVTVGNEFMLKYVSRFLRRFIARGSRSTACECRCSPYSTPCDRNI